MGTFHRAALLPLAATFAWPSLSATAQEIPIEALRVDQEETVNHIPVACTGIGQQREDPKWATYPLRIEVADPRGDLLAGTVVQLSDSRGRALVKVSCDAPWVLMRPTPGSYTVHATMSKSPGKPRTQSVTVGEKGQARVGITFPDS
jgi:hypothetical protein